MVNETLDIDLFSGIDTFFDMTYSTDIIFRTCNDGFMEAAQKMLVYINIYQTPKLLIMNIIYNFGTIFDSFRNGMMYFTGDSRGIIAAPYDAGYSIGYALYNVVRQS